MRQPDHIDHQHHFIDYLIRYYEDHFRIDDAIGWSYDREGHSFYVINVPRAGVTLVYDQTLRFMAPPRVLGQGPGALGRRFTPRASVRTSCAASITRSTASAARSSPTSVARNCDGSVSVSRSSRVLANAALKDRTHDRDRHAHPSEIRLG